MTAAAVAAPIVARTFGPARLAHVLVFALGLALAYLLGPSVLPSAFIAVLLWSFATSPAGRALSLILPFAFRLLLAVGAFQFEPPVQIVDLMVRGVDPLRLVAQQDIWWARYLVAYPAILMTDHWGMRFTDAFALYSAALLPVTALVLLGSVRVWRRLAELEAFFVGIGIALVIVAIATQMNGRLIAAHIGMAMILLAQSRMITASRLGPREAALLALGMVLSHMTSGTGLVAFATLIAGLALTYALGIDRVRTLTILWVISVIFAPLLYRDMLKNVDFYGGGVAAVITMLDHGPGTFLRHSPLVAAVAVAGAVAVVVVLWRSRRRILSLPRALWPAALSVPVTSIGGLYGYSTLTMGLPPLIILATSAAIAWSDRRRRSA